MRCAAFVLASLLCLAACDDQGESLRALTYSEPSQDAYGAALAEQYKTAAAERRADYEWDSSEYLAQKGLAASRGQQVLPEDPAQWNPALATEDFSTARVQLIQAIGENQSTQPVLTAAALVAYDQWVLTAAHATDSGRVASRRANFAASLDALQVAHVAQPGIASPSSEPSLATVSQGAPEAPTPPPVHRKNGPTILYFPFASDRLGNTANRALQTLAAQIDAAPKAGVAINGHTDRAGSEPYNMGLSERRAKFVLRTLEHMGVPAARMHYFAFGESDPAVPTADGVREPKNRRVEVVIE